MTTAGLERLRELLCEFRAWMVSGTPTKSDEDDVGFLVDELVDLVDEEMEKVR